jgi:iron complex outermembrane receptor protein
MAALGAVAVGACLPMTAALAQQTTGQQGQQGKGSQEVLEEIVVTGSILRRAETPSPVTVMNDAWLDERGINTVSEALQRMSANNAGTIVSNWNVGWNFASGATAPALRGLTVQDTLSIVDGQRLAPYPFADDGQRNFVDLSTVPNSIVDRIEVLRDGASSTYGADAIAGVVNVITKKEIQGFHLDGSAGFAQDGGGAEQRFDVSWGHGDLEADGANFYIAAEYQNQDHLDAADRGYPFNTADLTKTCGKSGSCMLNLDYNGVTAENGFYRGLISIPGITLVRPEAGPTATTGTGRFEFLNPSLGCGKWPSVSLTASQAGSSSPLTSCEVDYRAAFLQLQPDIERVGLSMRYTANIGDGQFYAMANYYKTDTTSHITPYSFYGTPTSPNPAGLASYNVMLPVYVCSTGVGTFDGLNTGCDASNGSLNPYNPYAAQGMRAQAYMRMPYGRAQDTSGRALRVALGWDDTFGDDWHYSIKATASQVGLTRNQNNYPIPQRIMDVVAQGTFNFADVESNSKEIWDYVTPESTTYSRSQLSNLEATIGKDLVDLPGGPLQLAAGLAYRYESINAPSANPANYTAPYTRYLSINAVGTAGSRDVSSAFFEVDAPVTDMLDLVASGRYDDYSSGQSNFSPKLGFKLTPIESLSLRGTYSEGFRIPSFNEAYGLPYTGFVSRTVNCTTYAAWCASHGTNAYATSSYSLGLTQIGKPDIDPEESKSYTLGVVWQTANNVTLTLDYWNIKVDGLIAGVTNTAAAEDQYYSNNGVVDLPGITVIPGNPDPAYPNALPILGFVQSSFTNQDKEKLSGVDFNGTVTVPVGNVDWTSSLDMSYMVQYQLTRADGTVEDYQGTLSPCNITSCSGAPRVRGSWQNTFQFNDKLTASLTIYYTSGYDTASIDYGGIKGACQYNADNAVSTASYADGSPVNCTTSAQWNSDLTASYVLNDTVTLYANVLNLLDTDPEFDPSAAYGIYNFNPAWAGPNIMGRYLRIGAKIDF